MCKYPKDQARKRAARRGDLALFVELKRKMESMSTYLQCPIYSPDQSRVNDRGT